MSFTERQAGKRGAIAPLERYAPPMRSILGTVRLWLPLIAGVGCLLVSALVGPIVGWLLISAAFVLLFDGCLAMFERARSTGTMSDHRQ